VACHETSARRTARRNKEEEDAIARWFIPEHGYMLVYIAADGCLKITQ
jgi:hypothetical protein